MSSALAEDVRVITTIGHVDHGKTTFVDYLLAANNIISSRMAGKIRYLDSREDEQQRGITMESSAVSLRFKVAEKTEEGESVQKTYVINLIDTPGHVDFSSEVSTASRLCDGALLLVDVVEGVCTQTISVLRQAWLDRVRPILVLNKCDRLITELKHTPVEAYHHLSQVIEQVNAVMGSLFAGERMEDDLRWREEREKRLAQRRDNQANHADAGSVDAESMDGANAEFQEKDDEDIYFAPERGNVVFASAIDGWGFRIGKFAQLYAAKLGMKEANLRRVLWGDYYLDPKTKRVIGHKHLKGRALKPLFVQFVLENIWAVYEGVVRNPNPEKVSKIITALNLKIPPRDLKSKDPRYLLSLIFNQWLSLSTCTIQTVIDIIPAPSQAQTTRMPKMLYPDLHQPTVEPKNKLERDLFSCSSNPDAAIVAYVSKMFAVTAKDLPENRRKPLTAEEMRQRGRELRHGKDTSESALGNGDVENGQALADMQLSEQPSASPGPAGEERSVLLGFARLYSGLLRTGSSIYCVLPKYNESLGPSHPRNVNHILKAKVEALYIMMGRELEIVDAVRAGNVFALRGLEGKVWRHATLCAPNAETPPTDDFAVDRACLINLGGIVRQTSPIVRVALEPTEPANLPKLVEGLRILNQADPAVETFQQQTGEHVILTAGELHLERCLKDLRERFAKVDIQPSEPIVPFRETAVRAPDMTSMKTPDVPRGTIQGSSAHSVVKFKIRAVPLPKPILEFIQDNLLVLRKILRERKLKEQAALVDSSFLPEDNDDDLAEGVNIHGDVFRRPTVKPDQFWTALEAVCKKVGSEWQNIVDNIWAFGPQTAGGCVLIDSRKDSPATSLRRRLQRTQTTEPVAGRSRLLQDAESSVETGFQIATFRGPLCAEPVEGIAYFVESLQIDSQAIEYENPQVIGSLISAVQDACRSGLLDWSPRLMLAMYTCDIQASTDVLGKMYGVVAKRRGRIVSEEMKEGTTFFTVRALLPVVESFGFADEIRKRTSGAASPQLIFSGYEMLDQDPFWVPTTEEELEDLGEKADRENIAKGYMDRVRERKGLFVDRKIVEFAEKQRTLKR
ncbi:P-loop containing nucleoside triphosphate hydrolase protein [Fomitiporia mediterranea MF3/22]|uniref:P-loop containing nucleoside triphosphate hydrolase protein n=1 Tax=Fomitiporia mediterranea (strain MF3/22) TaxID=694068 RepID=UPI0004407E3B|nr:P-loop containing nucleoside triphosphate hydrolase protein [Fomitiporia mediterranea MF3/22]EJC97981.1 P-loop containing nucleoside triphosphate hydrolase protein [Fomitiporia mediterranea MF3/22]